MKIDVCWRCGGPANGLRIRQVRGGAWRRVADFLTGRSDWQRICIECAKITVRDQAERG